MAQFDETKHNRERDGKFANKVHAEADEVPLTRGATPARREFRDGGEDWRLPNGYLHRDSGPARTLSDGTKEWFHNNTRHRADGPAVIRADGTQEWWEDGKRRTPPTTD